MTKKLHTLESWVSNENYLYYFSTREKKMNASKLPQVQLMFRALEHNDRNYFVCPNMKLDQDVPMIAYTKWHPNNLMYLNVCNSN